MHGSIPVKIIMHSWTADDSSDKGQFHQSPRGTSRKDILYHLVSHANIQWYMVLGWLIISVYYLLISTAPKYSQSHCKSGSWLGIPAQAQALQPPAACPVTVHCWVCIGVYCMMLHVFHRLFSAKLFLRERLGLQMTSCNFQIYSRHLSSVVDLMILPQRLSRPAMLGDNLKE